MAWMLDEKKPAFAGEPLRRIQHETPSTGNAAGRARSTADADRAFLRANHFPVPTLQANTWRLRVEGAWNANSECRSTTCAPHASPHRADDAQECARQLPRVAQSRRSRRPVGQRRRQHHGVDRPILIDVLNRLRTAAIRSRCRLRRRPIAARSPRSRARPVRFTMAAACRSPKRASNPSFSPIACITPTLPANRLSRAGHRARLVRHGLR